MKPEVMRRVEEKFNNNITDTICGLRGFTLSESESLRMFSKLNELIGLIRISTKKEVKNDNTK